MVDLTDEAAYRAAFRDNTRLVWIETPTNPTLKIVDIEQAASVAREKGAICAVDNTFATPYLQNPLDLGAHIVCHSTTKYIGGHSDAIGGVLCVNDDEIYDRLKFIQLSEGAVPGIQECFLFLRSTKTLGLRMERHCANAAEDRRATSTRTPPSTASSTRASRATPSTRSPRSRCATSAA
jgi:cystathionine gamma-lyase